MLNEIWEFRIHITDKPLVAIPEEHEILCFQVQEGRPYIWALINRNSPIIQKRFRLLGTGNPIDANINLTSKDYIGTIQLGVFVWHLFENSHQEKIND